MDELVIALKNAFPTLSDLVNVLSLFVSLVTLITMLRFKKRIRVEFDKRELGSKKTRLAKELDGCEGSLRDGLYTKDFLQKVDLLLNDILVSYSCLSFGLKVHIQWAIHFINHRCVKDATSGNHSYAHTLCKRLQRISILLRKEW